MKVRILAGLVVTLSVATASTQESGIQRVAWLQGCWETVSPQRTIEEQWRIGYQRSGPDLLLAWIEGTENGQARRVDFSYRRAACGRQ